MFCVRLVKVGIVFLHFLHFKAWYTALSLHLGKYTNTQSIDKLLLLIVVVLILDIIQHHAAKKSKSVCPFESSDDPTLWTTIVICPILLLSSVELFLSVNVLLSYRASAYHPTLPHKKNHSTDQNLAPKRWDIFLAIKLPSRATSRATFFFFSPFETEQNEGNLLHNNNRSVPKRHLIYTFPHRLSLYVIWYRTSTAVAGRNT